MSDEHSTIADVIEIIRNDKGPFVQLGEIFGVNYAGWSGVAAISPTAVYFLKKAQRMRRRPGTGVLGAVAAAFEKIDTLSTCTIENLSGPVRQQLDPNAAFVQTPVIVVPKAMVRLVEIKGLAAVLYIYAVSDRFNVETGFFKSGATRRKLNELGWAIGTMSPTIRPIHDTRQ